MKSPRIQVSIPPPAYESLKRFCAVSEQSMSGYISDIIVAVTPMLDALTINLAAAKSLKHDAEILSSDPFSVTLELAESALAAIQDSLNFDQPVPKPHATNPEELPHRKGGERGVQGAAENQSAPLVLTGGLGKTKNDQHLHVSTKTKHLWLASTTEGKQ